MNLNSTQNITNKPTSFNDIPNDALHCIAEYIDENNIGNYNLSCKTARDTASDKAASFKKKRTLKWQAMSTNSSKRAGVYFGFFMDRILA